MITVSSHSSPSAEAPPPAMFALPPEGLPAPQREKCFQALTAYILTQKSHFLGYQANQALDYGQDTKQFLDCHVNNIGDPFKSGNFTVNSKVMETAVLDYYARLWRAQLPHDPAKPESYWGYVLTMGSTEGNLYGLWNARDYLAGRKLLIDQPPAPKNRRVEYLHPKAAPNPNAYTPVAFFSEDTHYSIIKALRVLAIPNFGEIGRERYPGQNPIDPRGSWEGYDEVPSSGSKSGPGSIDIDKLATLVEFFARNGYPIMICCNFGTTFKGAYDDVEGIGKRLLPTFEKCGLVNRKVEYEKGKTDIRNGFWIHVDGALGASYMPFVEMANQRGLLPARGPNFDFGLPWVNSVVMSGHKWPGAPWPCGVYMTKVKYQLFPPDDPEYIGAPDTTFAGSRNGYSAIVLWDYLARHSYDLQIKEAVECEKTAAYFEAQLKTVAPYHPKIDLWIERTPLALTVRFRKPNDTIVSKYSLSCETLKIDGADRHFAHVFAMKSATPSVVDQLIEDLKAPNAFDSPETASALIGRGTGWR